MKKFWYVFKLVPVQNPTGLVRISTRNWEKGTGYAEMFWKCYCKCMFWPSCVSERWTTNTNDRHTVKWYEYRVIVNISLKSDTNGFQDTFSSCMQHCLSHSYRLTGTLCETMIILVHCRVNKVLISGLYGK